MPRVDPNPPPGWGPEKTPSRPEVPFPEGVRFPVWVPDRKRVPLNDNRPRIHPPVPPISTEEPK